MKFLTKKENALVTVINASSNLNQEQKEAKINEIKRNARLRSDGYRKPVKVFLHMLSNLKNQAIAAELKL
jgi:hypothetical protein